MKSQAKSLRSTRRRLLLENLEGRSLMAGDLTVAVVGGVLKVAGDDAANGVLIRQVYERPTTEGGTPIVKFAVVGVPLGEGNTTINHEAKPFIFGGDLTGLNIELGKGDDRVGFYNPGETATSPPRPVVLPGIATIAGGEGNDTVGGLINNAASVKIFLGAGNDKVFLSGSHVKEFGVLADPAPEASSTEAPPAGEDQVLLENMTAAGAVSLFMGGGSDRVGIKGGAFGGPVAINLGAGNDGLGISGVPGGAATTFANGLQITGDAGNELIGLLNVAITGEAQNLSILTDPPPPTTTTTSAALVTDAPYGEDQVYIDSVSVSGNTTIATGAGNDRVGIKGLSKFQGSVGIRLGGGNDAVVIGTPLGAAAILFGQNLEIGADVGDDQVGLAGIAVTGKIAVGTGDGADKVYIERVNASEALLVSLGAGDDILGVRGSKSPLAQFSGGEGTDRFYGVENVFATLKKEGFEPYTTTK